MAIGLLDTLADRLDVFISDLRLWCTLPAFGIMLEMDNHLYPISEWNRALAYLSGRPCAFSNVPEAKKYAKKYILSLIKEVELDGERNRT